MHRSETYSGYRDRHRMRTTQDVETWIGNSLATVLAGLAVAAGVIGMLLAFGYINEDSTNPFQDGMVWMIGGLILAICANVFRREHHVVDGGGEWRSEERLREEPIGVPPHTHS